MPTIKEHIEVIEKEINTTGAKIDNETLTADELMQAGRRLAELGSTLSWLKNIEKMRSPIKTQPLIKSIN